MASCWCPRVCRCMGGREGSVCPFCRWGDRGWGRLGEDESTREPSHRGNAIPFLVPSLRRARAGQEATKSSLLLSLSPSRIASLHGLFPPPPPSLRTPQPGPFSILSFLVIICGRGQPAKPLGEADTVEEAEGPLRPCHTHSRASVSLSVNGSCCKDPGTAWAGA